MKLISLTVPVLILSLTIIAIWGLGMLAVKASAISTQSSIDLLRVHLEVARLHDQLLEHSRQAVAGDVGSLLKAAPPVGEVAKPPAPSAPSEANAAEPWPEGAVEPSAPQPTVGARPNTVPTLEEGLRKARPALKRLRGNLDRALPH